jgi:hypothetical protein
VSIVALFLCNCVYRCQLSSCFYVIVSKGVNCRPVPTILQSDFETDSKVWYLFFIFFLNIIHSNINMIYEKGITARLSFIRCTLSIGIVTNEGLMVT